MEGSRLEKILPAAFAAIFLACMMAPQFANAQAAPARAGIVALTNENRAQNGVAQVQENPALDAAAQMKANNMAAQGYFSHTSPTGIAPWYWMTLEGYYYMDAGENLGEGFADAAGLDSAWMQSPSHRANILNPVYTEIGIGIAQAAYEGRPTTLVVQFFARPAQLTAAQLAAIDKSKPLAAN